MMQCNNMSTSEFDVLSKMSHKPILNCHGGAFMCLRTSEQKQSKLHPPLNNWHYFFDINSSYLHIP